MNYLLDTNVLVDHLRGIRSIPQSIAKYQIAVSIITAGELYCGAYKSHNPKKMLKHVQTMFNETKIPILSIDHETILLFAQQKVDLEKRGVKLEDFDVLIGATAIAHNFSLITANVKHFKRMKGLKIQSVK